MLEIRELEKNQENFESKFSSFLISRNKISNEISVIVNKIINEVREDGDQALRKITKRLDDFDCPTFQVTETEINTALKSFDKELLHSFEFAFEQLLEYQTSCFNSLDLTIPMNKLLESLEFSIPSACMFQEVKLLIPQQF